ncbi:hypothetical protein CH063_05707 [Colletotrichum higginsianum]|uniref:Uncharacterized protein n=1 Tax=Colletotrichum higginsianum (strain IMI 349063) TaxID=759273 RepID=H1UZY8_COLHI|nr:hypothetical protein CH063_05707 [Colletotrichum higginsianum]
MSPQFSRSTSMVEYERGEFSFLSPFGIEPIIHPHPSIFSPPPTVRPAYSVCLRLTAARGIIHSLLVSNGRPNPLTQLINPISAIRPPSTQPLGAGFLAVCLSVSPPGRLVERLALVVESRHGHPKHSPSRSPILSPSSSAGPARLTMYGPWLQTDTLLPSSSACPQADICFVSAASYSR